jgi:hypothetical protein
MKQAATRQLYEYWDELRGERASPERGEIDPAAIRGILADTFILEVDETRGYPFRLSGTRFNALFIEDLKGCSFEHLWAERDRGEILSILASVCDDVVPIVAGVEAAPLNRSPIELELLLLPVRHLGKTHARILGCMAPARLESWIGLVPVHSLSLRALRILPDLRRTAPFAPPSFSRPWVTGGAVADHAGRSVQRRGHLFVHQNDN